MRSHIMSRFAIMKQFSGRVPWSVRVVIFALFKYIALPSVLSHGIIIIKMKVNGETKDRRIRFRY